MKEYFEKQLRKGKTITVFASDNMPLLITREPYLCLESNSNITFNMDCRDLKNYCDQLGLSLKPTTH